MGYDLVTQNGTEETTEGHGKGQVEDCTPLIEEKASSILVRIWRWAPRIVGLMTRSVVKGVTVSIILGVVFGLAIGIGGTIYGADQSTQLVVGAASGYVSGVIAMVYVIVAGIKEARRMSNG